MGVVQMRDICADDDAKMLDVAYLSTASTVSLPVKGRLRKLLPGVATTLTDDDAFCVS